MSKVFFLRLITFYTFVILVILLIIIRFIFHIASLFLECIY